MRPFLAGRLAAPWGLDPAATPPAPDARRVEVLVNDSQCASGQSPERRIGDPDVRYRDDTVAVTFSADRPDGFRTCPTHDAVRRTVELRGSLGDRRLLDGSTVLALDPCPWVANGCARG